MVLTIAQNNYTFLLHCTSVITISYKLGSVFIFVRRICCFHSKIGKLVFMVLNFITVVCPRTELDILRDFGKHNIFFKNSFAIREILLLFAIKTRWGTYGSYFLLQLYVSFHFFAVWLIYMYVVFTRMPPMSCLNNLSHLSI